MFRAEYPIALLKGADYNPRKIAEQDIDILCESVRDLGVVKPIIVRNNTIVAGHQRTKALRKLGIETAPVFLLQKDTSLYDEIRFNQLHNGTDLDVGEEVFRVPPGTETGFKTVPAAHIQGNQRAKGATIRKEIAKLILAYGTWGSAVAAPDGTILHAAQYALACKAVNKACLIYYLDERQVELARRLLSRSYGEFCYDALPRQTYIQTFAQKFRLRGNKRGLYSQLYERMVLPWLRENPGSRVLDFGSGQGDYVKRLRREGVEIHEVEFFRRKAGSDQIDCREVHRMIDRLCDSVARDGLFDAVVCDSVFNSVDSVEAEQAVARVIGAFCKMGGSVFYSGRRKEHVIEAGNRTKATHKPRDVEFLDENGFSALYRKGRWFYQKFHSKAEALALTKLIGTKAEAFSNIQTSWQVHSIKTVENQTHEIASAIDFEFDIAWPIGRVGRAKKVRSVLLDEAHL